MGYIYGYRKSLSRENMYGDDTQRRGPVAFGRYADWIAVARAESEGIFNESQTRRLTAGP